MTINDSTIKNKICFNIPSINLATSVEIFLIRWKNQDLNRFQMNS